MALHPALSTLLLDGYLRLENRYLGAVIPPARRYRRQWESDPAGAARRQDFEDLWQSTVACGGSLPLIDYCLPYPKIDFLHYLCDEKGLVAHGSPLTRLETLRPIRESNDRSEFGNRQQIFASPDAAWAAWFAIVNKSKIRLTHNGCFRVGGRDSRWVKLYYFHLRLKNGVLPEEVFAPGMVYLARESDFPARRADIRNGMLGMEIEEWGSPIAVAPLARIPFEPADFPYFSRIEYI